MANIAPIPPMSIMSAGGPNSARKNSSLSNRSPRDAASASSMSIRSFFFVGTGHFSRTGYLWLTKDVSDPSQPPLTVDLFVTQSAGSGSMQAGVGPFPFRHSDQSNSVDPFPNPRPSQYVSERSCHQWPTDGCVRPYGPLANRCSVSFLTDSI